MSMSFLIEILRIYHFLRPHFTGRKTLTRTQVQIVRNRHIHRTICPRNYVFTGQSIHFSSDFYRFSDKKFVDKFRSQSAPPT